MTELATADAYGVLNDETLTLQRLLPGPVERVWAYLTESDLRRQWLAEGAMELAVGAPVTFTWRNDELTNPPGMRPEGFGKEHSMESRITELVPMRKLSIAWSGSGDVTFELEPRGSDILLTLTHRRIADRSMRLGVSAGWHSHLDILADKLEGRSPKPFWDHWQALRKDYDRRLPA